MSNWSTFRYKFVCINLHLLYRPRHPCLLFGTIHESSGYPFLIFRTPLLIGSREYLNRLKSVVDYHSFDELILVEVLWLAHWEAAVLLNGDHSQPPILWQIALSAQVRTECIAEVLQKLCSLSYQMIITHKDNSFFIFDPFFRCFTAFPKHQGVPFTQKRMTIWVIEY